MIDIYKEIFKKSEIYWNTRQNDIHVPCTYQHAKQLLKYYPDADRSIVLPAILLHDNGWSSVPEDRQRKAFGPKASDKQANRLHEEEGVRLAREILSSLNYNKNKIEEICLIIDGHDSRQEALSLNDELVKDADKLWRFTTIGVEIDHQRFEIEPEKHINWLSTKIKDWFFTTKAHDMAYEFLSETRLKMGY